MKLKSVEIEMYTFLFHYNIHIVYFVTSQNINATASFPPSQNRRYLIHSPSCLQKKFLKAGRWVDKI